MYETEMVAATGMGPVDGVGDGVGRGRGGARPWMGTAAGVAGLLVVWEVLALTVFGHKSVVPTPVAIVRQLWDDRHLYPRHVTATLGEAAVGWLIGNAVAVSLAVIFVVVPAVETALLRVAVASYCMPIVAIGPILDIVFSGERPEIALAGLSVFFTTLIGTTLGLRSADQASLDLVRVFGGGPWRVLVKVRLMSALPATFAALRIAAPASVLGAIIGEYLGGHAGLGVFMVTSEQALDVARTWGIALVATVAAGAGYALMAVAGRLLTPWAYASAKP
jgi:ABC-type nitrate/sulfonate/bicarbonate transport system permease component